MRLSCTPIEKEEICEGDVIVFIPQNNDYRGKAYIMYILNNNNIKIFKGLRIYDKCSDIVEYSHMSFSGVEHCYLYKVVNTSFIDRIMSNRQIAEDFNLGILMEILDVNNN